MQIRKEEIVLKLLAKTTMGYTASLKKELSESSYMNFLH